MLDSLATRQIGVDLIAQYTQFGRLGQNVFARHDIVADDTSHLYGQTVTKRFAGQGEIIRYEIRLDAYRGAVDVGRHDHPAGDFWNKRSQAPFTLRIFPLNRSVSRDGAEPRSEFHRRDDARTTRRKRARRI